MMNNKNRKSIYCCLSQRHAGKVPLELAGATNMLILHCDTQACISKQKLIDHIYDLVSSPIRTADNWDALSDILCDLQWIRSGFCNNIDTILFVFPDSIAWIDRPFVVSFLKIICELTDDRKSGYCGDNPIRVIVQLCGVSTDHISRILHDIDNIDEYLGEC